MLQQPADGSIRRGDGRRAIITLAALWVVSMTAYCLYAKLIVLDSLSDYVSEYGSLNAGGNFALTIGIDGGFFFLVFAPAVAATVVALVGLRRRPDEFTWINILRVLTLILVPICSAIVYWLVTSTVGRIIEHSVEYL